MAPSTFRVLLQTIFICTVFNICVADLCSTLCPNHGIMKFPLTAPCDQKQYEIVLLCCCDCHPSCSTSCTGDSLNDCNNAQIPIPLPLPTTTCSDGTIETNQQCDDRNLNDGDGCSQTCQVESGWTCHHVNSAGSQPDTQICSLQINIQAKVQSIIKDPYKNSFQITIIVANPNILMSSLNYSVIFDLGFTQYSSKYNYYQNGTIVGQVNYTESLHLKFDTYNFGVNYKIISGPLSNTKLSYKTPYFLHSSNNLAINHYPQNIYNQIQIIRKIALAICIISIITLLLSIFKGKIIGIELIATIQVTYCGLVNLKFSDPLFYNMNSLVYGNGYNLSFPSFATENLPPHLQFMQLQNQIFLNMNLMFVLPVLMLLIAFVMFILSKQNFLQYKLEIYRSYTKVYVAEYFFICLALIAYPFAFYIGIMLRNFSSAGIITYIGIGAAAVYLIALVTNMILFVRLKEQYYGELKMYFKTKDFYQKYYFLIHVLQKLVIGILLGLAGEYYATGIVVALILVAHAVCIGVFKPYGGPSQNIRSIIMMLIGAFNISIFVYLTVFGSSLTGSEGTISTSFLILGALCVSIVISLVYICLQIVKLVSIRYSLGAPAIQPVQSPQVQIQQLNKFEEQMKRRIERGSKPAIDLSKKSGLRERVRNNTLRPIQIQIPTAEEMQKFGDQLLERIINFRKHSQSWFAAQNIKKQLLQDGMQIFGQIPKSFQKGAQQNLGPEIQMHQNKLLQQI